MENDETTMTDEEAVSLQFYLNGQFKNCVDAMMACVARYRQECPDGLIAKRSEQDWIDLEARLHDCVDDMLFDDMARISSKLSAAGRYIGRWESRWHQQFQERQAAQRLANRSTAA